MNNARAFLKVKRRELTLRPGCERIQDYKDVFIPPSPEHSAGQASRCMDCGTPFCHWGCPAGNHIPEWNALMGSGRWMEAYKLLSSTNNFPEFTGRLCPAICEHACVLGINDEPVTVRENELAVTEYALRRGIEAPRPAKTGKKVAVIGSGPAGLAAADELNKAGHSVSVYEKKDKIGGMLRYGIPDFKLEKNILDRRIRMMEEAGIKFITGAECGKNPCMEFLRVEYDALCMAGGCESARDLILPGRELSGIYFAMDYLTMTNKKIAGEITAAESFIDAKNKKVVVIGGGGHRVRLRGYRQQAEGRLDNTDRDPSPPPPRQDRQTTLAAVRRYF
jgi:glutamate synthase (NADPH) small chain